MQADVSVDENNAPHEIDDFNFLQSSTLASVGTIQLIGNSIAYTVYHGKVYVALLPLLKALDLSNHVKKRGYIHLDKCLDGLDHCFLPVERKVIKERTHIWIIALSRMCSDLNKLKAGNASLKVKLKEDISMALESLTVDNTTQKSSAKCCKSLTEMAERHYGDDTTSFIDDLHHLFSRNGVNVPCLSKEDFVYLLKIFQNKQYFDECLKAAYCAKHALTPLELVYFQAKFSGTALFNELHEILPGIFPSHYTGIAPRLVAAGKWLSCGPGRDGTTISGPGSLSGVPSSRASSCGPPAVVATAR